VDDADREAAGRERDARKARYDAVIDRYQALGDDGDPALARALLDEAASLVDHAAAPGRLAALRYLAAQWSEADDAVATLAACADVLDIERADGHDPRVTAMRAWCREAVERSLDSVNPGRAEDAEPAIAALERIVDALTPNALDGLARLYEWRALGDPFANWQRRVDLLRRHVAAGAPGSDAQAQARNLLAVAEADEPNADFALAIERRIDTHRDVLASLQPGTPVHVETAIQLGTAMLDRALGDLASNGRAAEDVLGPALDAARRLGSLRHVGQAAALLARVQIFKQKPLVPERLRAGLALYAEARAAGEADGLTALVASVDKGVALAWLEALQAGDAAAIDPFLAACRSAIETFDAMPGYGDEVRKLLQMQADAAIAAGRHADAVAPLEQAMVRVRADLARATSRAGRLELAWRMRDSAALAAFCHASAGDARAACLALERGKGLFWAGESASDPEALSEWSGNWEAIVPRDGAVVVPTFAGADGMVVVATRRGDAAVEVDIVRLEGFGAAAVQELLQGGEPGVLGGWLLAYLQRADRPDAFREAIDRAGGELGRHVMAPIAARLEARGSAACAEVVWLPQGRTSGLPLRAAWIDDGAGGRRWFVDHHALRFAPSLAHLQRSTRTPTTAAPGRAVAFADPTGDLPFAAIEAAWLAEAMPDLEVLAGPAATADALLESLEGTRLLHVAGHGTFDIDDPFRSALLLAGDAPLTLDALLPALGRGAPRTVVLSACETAVTRVTAFADELLGFPAALLAHGVRTVLASLWLVDDVAAAFLMRAWHASRKDPDRPTAAEALRRAQVAVRDLRTADLLAALRPLASGDGPAAPIARAACAELASAEPEARPFATADAWSAFALWGAAGD
jgi:CHAT domain-containing protein